MQHVDLVVHVTRFLDRAQTQARLGQRLEYLDLRDIVRTFVHVRDMNRTIERRRRQVRPAAFQLRRAEPLQRIDQASVQTILEVFDDVDRGHEILLCRVELLVSVLDDTEVRQRFGGLGRTRSRDLDGESNDTLCDAVRFVVNSFAHQALVRGKLLQQFLFRRQYGRLRRARISRPVHTLLVRDRHHLVENAGFVACGRVFVSRARIRDARGYGDKEHGKRRNPL